jgi:hypothetical protein
LIAWPGLVVKGYKKFSAKFFDLGASSGKHIAIDGKPAEGEPKKTTQSGLDRMAEAC